MAGPTPIDISAFLGKPDSEEAKKACLAIKDSLMKTSCLVIRDPRVTFENNKTFIDMLERYFEQPLEKKLKDSRPALSYQVGSTPENTEQPVDHTKEIAALTPENSAHLPKGPDLKWRFFWRIGERPAQTKFAELNAEPVIPQDFPEWPTTMNNWGELMLQTVHTVSEMLAVGLDMPKNTFTDLLKFGPHLLAPTGSDLGAHGKLDTIFAGFHQDLNYVTIHGKSRFPGLYIWLRDGTRHLVKVPDGCLLLQAGIQMEWITGGAITAGFHEVVVTPETLEAVEKAKANGSSLWRVSSTLFSHVASDKYLKPLPPFDTPEALAKYPPTLAGDQVQAELDKLELGVNGQKKNKVLTNGDETSEPPSKARKVDDAQEQATS